MGLKITARIMWYSVKRPRPDALYAMLDGLSPAIVEDNRGMGCWWTARQCWQHGIDSGATHILVLADDALPCKNFPAALEHAVASRPNHILNFTSQTNDVRRFAKEAFDSGKSWVDLGLSWCSGVSLLMPRAMAIEFLAWADEHVKEGANNDEMITALFAATTDRRICCSSSSLVEHDPACESTINKGMKNSAQRTYRWAGDEADKIIWSSEGEPCWSGAHLVVSANRTQLKPRSSLFARYRLEWSV